MSVLSMFASVIISDGAQNDAASINVAGSLRMQSFRLASHVQTRNLTEQEKQSLLNKIDTFEQDLTTGILVNKQGVIDSDNSLVLTDAITSNWKNEIKPMLVSILNSNAVDTRKLNQRISAFVEMIDALVLDYQNHAEQNISLIRLIQSVALFSTILLICFAMLIVNKQIEKPLSQLTDVAKQLGRGDFTARADESGKDELALFGATFNKMSNSIYRSQSQLENQIRRKTQKLSRSNQSLDLLFHLSRKLNAVDPHTFDFQPVLDKLAKVTGIHDLDLCIMTAQGNGPYEHLISSKKDLPEQCIQHKCSECLNHDQLFSNTSHKMRYQLTHGNDNYGVFTVVLEQNHQLEDWQHQLFEAFAEQVGNGLSMKHKLEQGRRMALMNERTVIARELHDSLAQALSYLKIQVTRLQKLQQRESDKEQIESVVNELKTGLTTAYSELRELLTTFRLKLDGKGIKAALEQTISQLKTRNESFQFMLNYEVENIPFSPTEEIHLLQISREAIQNSFYHSQGSRIDISIINNAFNEIELTISDNGVGIPQDPNKLNHYGLAIMKERSRSVDGDLNIELNETGGTTVKFVFVPEYAKGEELALQNA